MEGIKELVRALRSSDGWEVRCVRCDSKLGTFDEATLVEAMSATRLRGGVLCPTCRASSCEDCGQNASWKKHVPGAKRRCYSCNHWYEKAIEEVIGSEVIVLSTWAEIILHMEFVNWPERKDES